MKRSILVKTCTSPHIGHIYEHLFCFGFQEELYEKNLFNALDFEFSGRTYRGGIVIIDLIALSKEAEVYTEKMLDYTPTINETRLEKVVYEISAEIQSELIGDRKKMLQSLQELHSQPWQQLEDFPIFDSRAHRRNWQTVTLKPLPKKAFQQIKIEFTLSENLVKPEPNLRLLFYSLAHILLTTVCEDLLIRHTYYGLDYDYQAGTSKPHISALMACHNNRAIDLNTVTDACLASIKKLVEAKFINKLHDQLSQSTYKVPYMAPDFYDVFETTYSFIGARGWRELATLGNLMKAFNGMELHVSIGKEETINKIEME